MAVTVFGHLILIIIDLTFLFLCFSSVLVEIDISRHVKQAEFDHIFKHLKVVNNIPLRDVFTFLLGV